MALCTRGSRNRGVDTAGQPADGTAVTDLLANESTCSSITFDIVQRALDPGSIDPVLDDLLAVGSMRNLGVVLHRKDVSLSNAATGAFSVDAVTSKPSGTA